MTRHVAADGHHDFFRRHEPEVREKTGDGLEAMERDVQDACGFFHALSLQITELPLNPLQSRNKLGAIIGTGRGCTHGKRI